MMPTTEDSGMDDSLYSDESADSKSAPESVDEQAAENPTALLPLSALGGKAKVGDILTLKIVKLHGDEAEVEIESAHEGKSESESDSGEEPDTDRMMEEM